MAGIFREGFDHHTTASLTLDYGIAGSSGVSATTPFGAGQSIQIPSASSWNGIFDSAVSSLTAHFMMSASDGFTLGTPLASTSFLRLNNGAATPHVTFTLSSTGEIIALRAGTTELGRTAANAIILDSSWHQVAVECVISDTVGRVTVYVNEVQVLNLTSQDTRNGATSTADLIVFGGGTAGAFAGFFDDLYVTDSATKLANHPRIVTLVPNSDGGTLNFTPSTGTDHYAVVDELPMSATDYLSASSVGDVDELALTNLSSTPVSIEEICIRGWLNKTDVAARTMYLGVKSGSTTSDGSAVTLGVSNDVFKRVLETDPDTSAAWTEGGINGLIVRPKVAS